MTTTTLIATPDPTVWRSLPVWAIELLDQAAKVGFFGTPWRSDLSTVEPMLGGGGLALCLDSAGWMPLRRDAAEALFRGRIERSGGVPASATEWAERYLTAIREGRRSEATRIYIDAVYALSYREAREFSDIVDAEVSR